MRKCDFIFFIRTLYSLVFMLAVISCYHKKTNEKYLPNQILSLTLSDNICFDFQKDSIYVRYHANYDENNEYKIYSFKKSIKLNLTNKQKTDLQEVINNSPNFQSKDSLPKYELKKHKLQFSKDYIGCYPYVYLVGSYNVTDTIRFVQNGRNKLIEYYRFSDDYKEYSKSETAKINFRLQIEGVLRTNDNYNQALKLYDSVHNSFQKSHKTFTRID